MKWNRCRVIRSELPVILFLTALLFVAGCAQSGFRIKPLSNHDTAHLDLKDIIGLMLQAGFSDDQIHLYGSELRDVLAKSGAARIYINNVEEATFYVDYDCVYVSSKSQGMFIYYLNKELFDNY
jgi:hypothetical protein